MLYFISPEAVVGVDCCGGLHIKGAVCGETLVVATVNTLYPILYLILMGGQCCLEKHNLRQQLGQVAAFSCAPPPDSASLCCLHGVLMVQMLERTSCPLVQDIALQGGIWMGCH